MIHKNIRLYFLGHLKLLGGLFILSYPFFLFFSAVNAAQIQKEPQYGGAIVDAAISDARTLVPILASDSSSAQVCSLLFNGLIKYDKNINIAGDLAESWEIKDGGLTIVFHLRRGVRWHDGRQFSAEDVKFTYEKLTDPNVRTPYSGDFHKVKNFRIIDAYTVEISYEEPFAPGLSSWGMWIMPRHILKDEDLNETDFSSHPIGTGPYMLKKWSRQEKIELVANPDYFEGSPYILRYIYRIIPDQSSIFLELQTKGVDSSLLTPLQYTRQTDNAFFKKNYNKYKLPGFGYTYLGYNLNDEKFKDVRVRRAFNYAVDKREIIKIILLGLGEISTGPFAPQSWAYNHQVEVIEYNPKKAAQLLEEAGWKDNNGDGYLDKDGKVFEFTIITNQGNEQRLKAAEIIQKYLKDVGVRVKIKVLEWSSLLAEFIDKRRFEAILLGWSLGREPDCHDIWHSSKTKEGEFNFIGYMNPHVDELLIKARRTFDIRKRRGYYHEVHKIIYEDQPCMFLYAPNSLQIISSRINGIEPAPIGIGYNFIKWWVPKDRQIYNTHVDDTKGDRLL